MSVKESVITPTPKDKGMQMTVTVTAYDNGILMVGERVIDEPDGWPGAAEVVMRQLRELHRATLRRS